MNNTLDLLINKICHDIHNFSNTLMLLNEINDYENIEIIINNLIIYTNILKTLKQDSLMHKNNILNFANNKKVNLILHNYNENLNALIFSLLEKATNKTTIEINDNEIKLKNLNLSEDIIKILNKENSAELNEHNILFYFASLKLKNKINFLFL